MKVVLVRSGKDADHIPWRLPTAQTLQTEYFLSVGALSIRPKIPELATLKKSLYVSPRLLHPFFNFRIHNRSTPKHFKDVRANCFWR